MPDAKQLRYLYVNLKQPTTAIAQQFGVSPKGVNQALERAGIPRRTKHNGTFYCQIPGCREHVQRIHHDGNGADYGTMCGRHRDQHRAKLQAEYTRRKRDQGFVVHDGRWVRPEEAERTRLINRFVRMSGKPVSKERTLDAAEAANLFGLEEETPTPEDGQR